MSKAPSMPLFCGDYLADTKHLNLEQHGAYLVLLMVTWRNNGKAIQDDPDLISKYLGCTRDRWLKKIRPILAPMFDLDDGVWRSKKLEEQWAYVQKSIETKRVNGGMGGRPPARKTAEELANLPQQISQEISATQAAKSLENNGTDKAVGSVSVEVSLSTQPQPRNQEEVSKKESPLSPPNGGCVNGVLFPVQEVQHAPARDAKGPRRKKHQSLKDATKASPEIEAAFVEFKSVYPRRNHPHSWGEAKELFVEAMESGVSGDLLIQTAEKFAKIVRADGDEGTRVVADARTWLFQRRWERYADFQPVPPKMNGSNVTQLRNGTTNQPVQTAIRRGGLTY